MFLESVLTVGAYFAFNSFFILLNPLSNLTVYAFVSFVIAGDLDALTYVSIFQKTQKPTLALISL